MKSGQLVGLGILGAGIYLFLNKSLSSDAIPLSPAYDSAGTSALNDSANFKDVSKKDSQSVPNVTYNVSLPSSDGLFSNVTPAQNFSSPVTSPVSSGSSSSYYSTNSLSQTTKKEVNIFTPTSSTSADRFAVNPTTGGVADRYAQQSVSQQVAQQRQTQASVPKYVDIKIPSSSSSSSTKKSSYGASGSW